eukprot:595563-Pelagomonas_calceolata.AAC.1
MPMQCKTGPGSIAQYRPQISLHMHEDHTYRTTSGVTEVRVLNMTAIRELAMADKCRCMPYQQ